MRTLITLFAVWIALSLGSCNLAFSDKKGDCIPIQNDKNGDLTLDLQLSSQVFTQDESIPITLTLKNVGLESMIVNKGIIIVSPDELIQDDASHKIIGRNELATITLILVEKKNCKQYFGDHWVVGLDINDFKNDFVLLKPGETVENNYLDVREFYFTQLVGPTGKGSYYLYAIYNNPLDSPDGSSVWKGEIASNIFTITIKP